MAVENAQAGVTALDAWSRAQTLDEAVQQQSRLAVGMLERQADQMQLMFDMTVLAWAKLAGPPRSDEAA